MAFGFFGGKKNASGTPPTPPPVIPVPTPPVDGISTPPTAASSNPASDFSSVLPAPPPPPAPQSSEPLEEVAQETPQDNNNNDVLELPPLTLETELPATSQEESPERPEINEEPLPAPAPSLDPGQFMSVVPTQTLETQESDTEDGNRFPRDLEPIHLKGTDDFNTTPEPEVTAEEPHHHEEHRSEEPETQPEPNQNWDTQADQIQGEDHGEFPQDVKDRVRGVLEGDIQAEEEAISQEEGSLAANEARLTEEERDLEQREQELSQQRQTLKDKRENNQRRRDELQARRDRIKRVMQEL